jgi:hypothetical protein
MNEQRHLNSPLVCLFGPGFRVSFGVSLGLSFRVNFRLTHGSSLCTTDHLNKPVCRGWHRYVTVNADISSLLTI